MTSHRFVAALAAVTALACLRTASAADLTPEAAKWIFALGRAAAIEAGQTSGDAAKAKRKDALTRLEHAVAMQPGNADYQFWLGSASFEKAIALDPGHVAAHVGLSQFYLGAPGIAGGSVEKAKAQGNALLAIPEKRGEYQGHMVLAGIAAHDENWAEMTKEFTAAETAGGDGADPVGALRSHAWYLVNKKKDPQAALPIVERYVKAAPADDLTALFLDGEVKRQLGQKDAARRDYEEYARRFPSDDRAKEAKAAVKRLAGS